MEGEMGDTRAMPDQLPYDVVFNILTRLPVKSVLRVRSVCTLWCEVVSDPRFVRTHLELANRNTNISLKRHMIMTSFELTGCPPYINSIDYETRDLVRLHLPFENISFVDSEILASCNGLLVVGIGERSHFLWNPLIRVYREIPCQYHFKDENAYRLYGLGVDLSSNSFKVLRVVRKTSPTRNIRQPSRNSDSFYDSTNAKLYSSQTNSWRRMEDFPYNVFTNKQAVLVNGDPHYLVIREIDDSERKSESESETKPKDRVKIEFVIIYFDFTEEKFKELVTLDMLAHDSMFTFGSSGGLLCLVIRGLFESNEVWVMKEYGVKESWTRLWSTRLPYALRTFVPLCYTKDDEILLESDYSLVDYSLTHGTTRKVFSYGSAAGFNVASYVESLVWPLGGELVRY